MIEMDHERKILIAPNNALTNRNKTRLFLKLKNKRYFMQQAQ